MNGDDEERIEEEGKSGGDSLPPGRPNKNSEAMNEGVLDDRINVKRRPGAGATEPGAVSGASSLSPNIRSAITRLEEDALAKALARNNETKIGAVAERGAAPVGKRRTSDADDCSTLPGSASTQGPPPRGKYHRPASTAASSVASVGASSSLGADHSKASGRSEADSAAARQRASLKTAAVGSTETDSDAKSRARRLSNGSIDAVTVKSRRNSEPSQTRSSYTSAPDDEAQGYRQSDSVAGDGRKSSVANSRSTTPDDLLDRDGAEKAQSESRHVSRNIYGEELPIQSDRRRSSYSTNTEDESVPQENRSMGTVSAPAYGQGRDAVNDDEEIDFQTHPFVDGNYNPPRQQFPPVHMAVEDMLFDETGGIQAYVADTVVDATGVAVLESEDDVIKYERRKYIKRGIICAILLIIVIIVVVVPVSLKVFKNNSSPTFAPSSMPSLAPSAAPTTQDYMEVIERVGTVSKTSLLLTEGTPQNKALKWYFQNNTSENRTADVSRFLQRYIFALFYFATSNGDGWAECGEGDINCAKDQQESWLSEYDECNWFGLTCTDDVIVDRIFIATKAGNNLVGTLPDELGHLTALSSLILQSNFLNGTVPSIYSNLTKLETLVLTDLGLEEPFNDSILENMTLLGTLYLDLNRFSGTIPSSIFNLSSLEVLRLSRNQYNGTIPTEFGSLVGLTQLELSDNKIRGVLPSEIGRLVNAQLLDVHDNRLSGSLPDEFYSLNSAKTINLANNSFTGELSSSIALLGINSTGTVSLDFSDNLFNGPIPSEFGNIANLGYLLLNGNEFTGAIASEICNLPGISNCAASLSPNNCSLTVDCTLVQCSCCNPSCDA